MKLIIQIPCYNEAETLEILMEDAVTKVQAVLLYGVLPKYDIITRSVRIINQGEDTIHISKAASAVWISFQETMI